jgi:photosystem II stability/assembly factor-like uncharacterized protein
MAGGTGSFDGLWGLASSANGAILYATASGQSPSGSVWKSSDRGQTWASLASSPAYAGGVTCDAAGSTVVATVYGGYVHISRDGGATWTQLDPLGSASPDLYSMPSASADGRTIAVSSYGYIYVSTDAVSEPPTLLTLWVCCCCRTW